MMRGHTPRGGAPIALSLEIVPRQCRRNRVGLRRKLNRDCFVPPPQTKGRGLSRAGHSQYAARSTTIRATPGLQQVHRTPTTGETLNGV
jgi:hypothetical protein